MAEQEVKEFDLGYAFVRVHFGKLSSEERKVVIENAARDFYRAIQKTQNKKAQ